MKKRGRAACMALLLCLLAGFARAEKEELRDGDFLYRVAEDGAVLAAYSPQDGESAVVRVPDTLGGLPLVAIGPYALGNFYGYYDGEKVDAIVIPEGVVRLEEEAFQCCHDVKTIAFPSSLEVIPEGCFMHVSAEISFPNGNPYFTADGGYLIDTRTNTLLYTAGSAEMPLPPVERIGERAIERFAGRSEITLPDTLKSLGAYIFYDWAWLTSVTIPDGVTELSRHTFYVTGLEEVILPDGLTEIPEQCFRDSQHLVRVKMPANLESIGAFAFYGTEIEWVELPDTVDWIGYGALPCEWTGAPKAHLETEEEYFARGGEWFFDGYGAHREERIYAAHRMPSLVLKRLSGHGPAGAGDRGGHVPVFYAQSARRLGQAL